MLSFRILIVLFSSLACFAASDQFVVPDARPAILIYCFEGGDPPNKITEKGLVFALWETGDILWSTDSIRGGKPLLYGNIGGKSVSQLIWRFQTNPAVKTITQRKFVVIDDAYVSIQLHTSLFSDMWVSAHEVLELNKNVVAMSYGLIDLKGKTRKAWLEQDDASFVEFRQAWENQRKLIQSVVPGAGISFDRKIKIYLR